MGDLTKNLSRYEFACRCGCGFDTVDIGLPDIIQDVVDFFQAQEPEGDIRVEITGPNRCWKLNSKTEGASSTSMHLWGKAADFVLYDKKTGIDIHADKVATYLEARYPDSLGIGRYKGRTHVDTRTHKARWDKR